MKRPVFSCLLLSILLGAASCNRHIYVPNTVNVPLLKERHEFKGSLSPTNYQAAFAVSNHVAVMANGQYVFRFDPPGVTNEGDDLLLNDNTRGGLIEGAVGYFTSMDLKKRMMFDVFAGYGNGSFKTITKGYNSGSAADRNDYLLKSRFNKFFIQPSVGFVHPVVETAFSSRVSLVQFYQLYAGGKAFENSGERRANFLKIGDKLVPFFEPTFTVRVGYKYVKFQAQLQFSLLLNDAQYSGYEISEYFQPVAFGMGASINIAQWYKEVGWRRGR
ncbi:hypothetical protein KTO58_20450 [Chitinophaga pendula]|uniref:hypothetical protein n=1 Tax=Chitinophaga TaxID=79328 RepID=UPI000BAFD1FA|nr:MULTISPECIES: hypothetical protein [Chitinophaga]ASZ10974.1 hypothetical protein CK934_08365 [Chitinophaga sp. MD30]UCJ06036.1 hypothetical protein KTO58_20450 [Chitinophaga pendula]